VQLSRFIEQDGAQYIRGSAVDASWTAWTAWTAWMACDLRAAVIVLVCRLNLRLVKNRLQD
jgi:hypothetical protein